MSDETDKELEEFWEEMTVDRRTPEQKAWSKGYTEGFLACEAEQRRKDGLREKYAEDDVTPLWDKLMRKEPLTADEAVRVGREVHLVIDKHVSNGTLLMHLFEQLQREYARGQRCSVCARHKSENHNCAIEC